MKLLVALLLGLCALPRGRTNTVNLNTDVDQLLTGLNAIILEMGEDVQVIPDIYYPWEKKLGLFSVTGTVTCRGGWLGRLSSLQRAGDVTMVTVGNLMSIHFSLGLGELTAHFDKCQIMARKLGSASAKVDMPASHPSVEARILVGYTGNTCTTSIHTLVRDLGNVRFDTGGGLFHKFESGIVNGLTKLFKGKIEGKINDKLQEVARSSVFKMILCDKLRPRS